jgi:hypothetical protein
MHNDKKFKEDLESLSGFITTNHDGLLQVASEVVHGGISLGYDFVSSDFKHNIDAPPIFQLHGSFTWKFGTPIKVTRLNVGQPDSDAVWIPPSINKEARLFPFNKLQGLSYELLVQRCDVLRVVGASLTQNDWNIQSLIFNAQKHRLSVSRQGFSIELILPQKAGERIKQECSYLGDIFPIATLLDGDFSPYTKEDEIQPDSDYANPVAYWLDQKILHHRRQDHFAAPADLGV